MVQLNLDFFFIGKGALGLDKSYSYRYESEAMCN